MAVAKLNPLFFHNPTLLPTVNPSPQNLPLLPFKNPSTLSLKTNLNFLTFKTAINQNREENESSFHHYFQNAHHFSVAFPALAFSNTLFFATNVTLVVGEDVGEEKLIGQFRREVLKAGVLQECRRRRFFESSQEKRKRKSREAARRNRKRRPQPKVLKDKVESSKKKTQQSNDDNDNWEFLDIDLPYC